jgi:GGDEF domain-containing protein
VDKYGIERGDVLLSLQLLLTREEEQGWGTPPREAPVAAVRSQEAPPARDPLRTAVGQAGLPPAPMRPVVMVDPDTGAGTLHALRRDLSLETERVQGAVTAVVALEFRALDQLRLVLGDGAAEEVVKGLVEVAPFALGARDRVYRSARDQLILVLPGADDERVEAARWALELSLGRFLSDRHFPEVKLGTRRVDPAALAG